MAVFASPRGSQQIRVSMQPVTCTVIFMVPPTTIKSLNESSPRVYSVNSSSWQEKKKTLILSLQALPICENYLVYHVQICVLVAGTEWCSVRFKLASQSSEIPGRALEAKNLCDFLPKILCCAPFPIPLTSIVISFRTS